MVGRPLSGVFACVESGGGEVDALSDVRRTDARSAQIERPEGVTLSFQVSAYNVEPAKAVAARNLLSKDDWRTPLRNESGKLGPEMPGVGFSPAFSG